jgi:hypothetical protein
MTFDSDIQRLRLASQVGAALAATLCIVLLLKGLYLPAASCGVMCFCNLIGLATLKAHQMTRDLYREIREMKRGLK